VTSAQTPPSGPFLVVRDLFVHYSSRAGLVRAVDGVSFDVAKGEAFALVGESGCGKSSTGRAIVQLERIRHGQVTLGGAEISALHGADLRRTRRRFQMVFQDPYTSLDPRLTAGAIIRQPLDIHRIGSRSERRTRSHELLRTVGLDETFDGRYPRQLSGGQRQRVGIARALVLEPDLLVCDEPISALDVSIQAQVINLLERLQSDLGLTYLFIAHDLAVVRHIADRVAVKYLGKIVEIAPADLLYAQPLHPYTVALLSAVPVPDARVERSRRRIILKGDIPSPANPPSGCRFHTRCWLRERLGNPEICATEDPPLAPIAAATPDQTVACHFASELVVAPPQDVVPEVEEEPVVVPVEAAD
jgi:oligopeptide/dipeptide ABC transporter ATP-binding protein